MHGQTSRQTDIEIDELMGIQRIRGAMEKHMMSIKFYVIVEIVILVQTVFQFQLAHPPCPPLPL